MRKLRHSYEFDALPSERVSKIESSLAAKTLHKVARKALGYGPAGVSVLADRSNRDRRQLRDATLCGKSVELTWNTRPGEFIKDQAPEVRSILRELTSDDASKVSSDIEPWELQDYEVHPEPGKRYRFGVTEARLPTTNGAISYADAPTIWTFTVR